MYPHFSYFQFFSTILHHGQGNWYFFKNNHSKLSTSTLKKHVLSSSAEHTSSASNLTRTIISYRLDNKYITTNQNKNNISNIDDIHSCVTPQKQIYSVQATSTTTHLNPLNATIPIQYVKLHTTTEIPPAVK